MKEIVKCTDGKYRWTYEVNLYKNPTILFLLWKVFLITCAAMFLFMSILSVIEEEGVNAEVLLKYLRFFAVFTVGMLLLCTVSYYIFALISGGKYCAYFELDQNGVNHVQMPRQVKRSQVIGAISVLAGLASGSIGGVGRGLIAASRTSMYSNFKRVRKVRAIPKRNVIKVNTLFTKNQVYVGSDDFEFVVGFIENAVASARNSDVLQSR